MKDIDLISTLLTENYSDFGIIESIVPYEDETSPNAHFKISASNATYFLKVSRCLDSFFQGDGVSRIEAISDGVLQLHQYGLLVERCIKNKRAQYVTINNGYTFRLYDFIKGRGFNGSSLDIQEAAASMSRLHKDAGTIISKHSRDTLYSFGIPYQLESSIENIGKIETFINRFAASGGEYAPIFQHLIDNFSYIRRAINIAKTVKTNSNVSFVHLDFHPDNVIYDNSGRAHVIDFDNAMFASSYKCSAFSILRFSLYNRKLSSIQEIVKVAEIWARAEGSVDLQKSIDIYIDWMLYVELEKILRIVSRFFSTKEHGIFLKNIATLHMRNLKAVVDYY